MTKLKHEQPGILFVHLSLSIVYSNVWSPFPQRQFSSPCQLLFLMFGSHAHSSVLCSVKSHWYRQESEQWGKSALELNSDFQSYIVVNNRHTQIPIMNNMYLNCCLSIELVACSDQKHVHRFCTRTILG
jgi:hypothetical protein